MHKETEGMRKGTKERTAKREDKRKEQRNAVESQAEESIRQMQIAAPEASGLVPSAVRSPEYRPSLVHSPP